MFFSLIRVGLMGNPSDGFHGKTISMSIENFWAEVTIKESEKLVSFVSFKSHMHSCNAQLSQFIPMGPLQDLVK